MAEETAPRGTARWSSPRSLLALLGFLLAVAVAAGLGGYAAGSAGSQYERLDQPPFAPPSWLFGPVWTVLYVLVAVAAWLVWLQPRRGSRDRALVAWGVQLVLNAAWTPLFFGAGLYGVALVEIVLLLTAVAATTVLFAARSRPAAALMTPYLAWVAFATLLNASIWWLNR